MRVKTPAPLTGWPNVFLGTQTQLDSQTRFGYVGLCTKGILDPAAHGRGPRRERNKPLLPSPRPSATLGASIADPGPRCPGLRLARARQNTILWPRRSTDLTKAAVRPPKFLPGIPSTCGIPSRSPNPGALADQPNSLKYSPLEIFPPLFRAILKQVGNISRNSVDGPMTL